MDNNALVSVIVPIYKVEKYLDECVQSLVNQTYTNLEIVLVDDGSPDNCPAMCDIWKKRDNRIKVVHKTNGGVSDARNTGIEYASGTYLLFVDSDDVIADDFVESLVAVSQQHSALVVSSVVRFQDEIPAYKLGSVKRCDKQLASARGGMYAWGVLYSRELVDSIDLRFDVSLRNLEDVTWNAIYLRYISEVMHVDVPYFYRMNPTSITSKCSDYKWQVASWIAARRSITNWFANKPLTAEQRKEVAGMYRHCQNNIHAECVAGNISYSELHAMECEPSALFDQSLISAPERFVRTHCPKLYYGIYTFMIRTKNAIRK